MSSSSSADLHAGVVGFNNKADAYDHARPRFPLDAIRDVLASLQFPDNSSSEVVAMCDLAAGTGIFTRNLIDVLQEKHANNVVVDAVEPVAGMRNKLVETTSNNSKRHRRHCAAHAGGRCELRRGLDCAGVSLVRHNRLAA
jgi:hypothetical protein